MSLVSRAMAFHWWLCDGYDGDSDALVPTNWLGEDWNHRLPSQSHDEYEIGNTRPNSFARRNRWIYELRIESARRIAILIPIVSNPSGLANK
jgi:hypothetical protein